MVSWVVAHLHMPLMPPSWHHLIEIEVGTGFGAGRGARDVSGAEPALDSSVGFFLFFWLLVVLRVLALVGFVTRVFVKTFGVAVVIAM
jgi:hypothetical protein